MLGLYTIEPQRKFVEQTRADHTGQFITTHPCLTMSHHPCLRLVIHTVTTTTTTTTSLPTTTYSDTVCSLNKTLSASQIKSSSQKLAIIFQAQRHFKIKTKGSKNNNNAVHLPTSQHFSQETTEKKNLSDIRLIIQLAIYLKWVLYPLFYLQTPPLA